MSESFADDWLGIEKPKLPEPPKIIPPAKVPTQDEAQDRQQKLDATRFRTGRASTRLASGGLTGATRAFRLLGGTA
jgi:hypothetical protein